jgi:hypothetical protein
MKKKMLGFSAALLMICSLGVNSISAQNMQCILDPDSVTRYGPDMVCGTYNCPDGTEAYACKIRGIIIE